MSPARRACKTVRAGGGQAAAGALIVARYGDEGGTRMVRMGTVWDRTTEVLSGRGGALGRIAFLGIFVPSVVRDAFAAYAGPGAPAALALVGALVSLAVLVVLIWSQLALIALSTDPAITPAIAAHTASRRLGPALAIVGVLAIALLVLLTPPLAVLLGSGANVSPELMRMGIMPHIAPGTALFVSLYLLVLLILLLVVGARLWIVNAVVVNERLGLGAIRRSFALTRGSTWRIIGVLFLYAIVLFVATLAAQSVVGLVFRLVLGADAKATVLFLATVAASAVSAVLTTVAAAFAAQLYVAAIGRDDDRRVASAFE